MSLTDHLKKIDSKLAKGKLVDSVKDYYDKSVVTHIQHFITNKGKSASNDLARVEERIKGGKVEVIASRVLEEESATVTLVSFEGPESKDGRFKLLMLIARLWSEKGKIVEEEYLPIRSASEAQTYFPGQRVGTKQIQTRLSFITPTRKKRAKGGGRPRKPIAPTDLHRIPTIGKTVVEALNNAGVSTFEKLSKAKDDLLEKVRSQSGRRFVNFDPSYWRTAAGFAASGEWDKMPAAPKAEKKVGKRNAKIDFTQVGDADLDQMPKVGPGMLAAMQSLGLETFTKLAKVTDEQLAQLKEKGGRPFVNFDMSYFRKAAQKKVDGAKHLPAPPKPVAAKKASGKVGRKPKEINPNDLHELPGVGAQMIKALHEAGINTFADVAAADKTVLTAARSQTKGKYKNINIGFLQKMAKYAAAGKFDKLDKQVKIEKAPVTAKASAQDRLLAKLQKAAKSDLDVLPGVGASVKTAMNEAGIKTFSQLAKAKEEKLKEIAANAGKRYARFDVEFWKKVAAHAHAGEFDQIPVKPPTAPKPKPSGKKRGGQRGPRTPRPPRTPKSNSDLGALPTIGATIINALHENKIKTFAQLASASEAKLTEVRDASGPKYKTFPVAYWKEVAALAKEGTYEYPAPPKKEKKVSTGRRGRKPKAVEPTNLRALAGVGASLATTLKENGLNTWQDIVNAEAWKISKSASEAGRRFAKLNPEELRKSAKDAINGKFPERKKRAANSASLPEGADKLTELPGIGAKVQEKLFERKVLTYSDLSKATIGLLEEVRDEVGRRVAKANVRDWKEMARLATQGNWSKIDPSKYEDDVPAEKKVAKRPSKPKDGDDLTKIKGIGPQAQQMFRSRGVKTYQDVLALSDNALAALLEDSGARVKPEDFAKVQEAAAKALSKNSTGTKAASKAKAKAAPKAKAKAKAAPKAKPKAKAKRKPAKKK